jgi:mono/diheme cytochrome c family protein
VKQSALLTGIVALTLASVFVRAQGHTSTRDGVYTDVQAARGHEAYKTSCLSCHGESLEGSGAQNPPLAGKEFTANWNGQPLGELFDKIQTSMPADKPGTLSRSVNAEILAYILQVNKLPAGRKELPVEPDTLKQIQFDAAKN